MRTKEDIIHALEDGADYICLAGDVVKAPEQGYEALKEYIDFVHRAARVLTITAATADIRRNEERSCILWRFLEKGLGFRPRLISLL